MDAKDRQAERDRLFDEFIRRGGARALTDTDWRQRSEKYFAGLERLAKEGVQQEEMSHGPQVAAELEAMLREATADRIRQAGEIKELKDHVHRANQRVSDLERRVAWARRIVKLMIEEEL